jgi:hypothetical protein
LKGLVFVSDLQNQVQSANIGVFGGFERAVHVGEAFQRSLHKRIVKNLVGIGKILDFRCQIPQLRGFPYQSRECEAFFSGFFIRRRSLRVFIISDFRLNIGTQ